MMIVKRTAYEAKHKGRRKIYATKKGALGRLAWWMIFDKYEPIIDGSVTDDTGRAYPNAEIAQHPDCDCVPIFNSHYGEYEEREDWTGCPIHDRETGYYRRLHDRFVRRWNKCEGGA